MQIGDERMNNPFVEYLISRDLVSAGVARQLVEHSRTPRDPVGMIAVAHGLLLPDQIDLILDEQRQSGERFGEAAVRLGFVTEDQVGLLLKVQELRAAAEIGEALVLAGVLEFEEMAQDLGGFLMRGQEVMEMIADDA